MRSVWCYGSLRLSAMPSASACLIPLTAHHSLLITPSLITHHLTVSISTPNETGKPWPHCSCSRSNHVSFDPRRSAPRFAIVCRAQPPACAPPVCAATSLPPSASCAVAAASTSASGGLRRAARKARSAVTSVANDTAAGPEARRSTCDGKRRRQVGQRHEAAAGPGRHCCGVAAAWGAPPAEAAPAAAVTAVTTVGLAWRFGGSDRRQAAECPRACVAR